MRIRRAVSAATASLNGAGNLAAVHDTHHRPVDGPRHGVGLGRPAAPRLAASRAEGRICYSCYGRGPRALRGMRCMRSAPDPGGPPGQRQLPLQALLETPDPHVRVLREDSHRRPRRRRRRGLPPLLPPPAAAPASRTSTAAPSAGSSPHCPTTPRGRRRLGLPGPTCAAVVTGVGRRRRCRPGGNASAGGGQVKPSPIVALVEWRLRPFNS